MSGFLLLPRRIGTREIAIDYVMHRGAAKSSKRKSGAKTKTLKIWNPLPRRINGKDVRYVDT